MKASSLFKILAILSVISLLVFNCKSDKKKTSNFADPDLVERAAYHDQLLDTIQYQTFNYFWEGAEPNSGLARERIHMDDVYPTSPKNTVTIGGSGFGFMALLVGVKRGFISREEALNCPSRCP